MTYHISKDYKERYYILFEDVDGTQWRVSIQDPIFSGTATALTGGANPIIWEGEGDESQEEVVLGSTGKISLICLDGQQSLFTEGNILPSSINDRRVQVFRNMGNSDALFWQGFIKPETFSQDWDSAPYEIELPIVSAIAATEYFIMPLPSEEAFNDPFWSVSNIAALIRAIIVSVGCDFRLILTNKPELLDMAGNTVMIERPSLPGEYYPEHWTQGTVSSMWFYDVESGVMKPKTFKDVLEEICYPYGKIHEYGYNLAFLMRTKDDAASEAPLFQMPVWEDESEGEIDTSVRFTDFEDDVMQIAMSDIETASTDNTKSLLHAPKSVSFSNDIEKKQDIFELTDKFIKPTLPLGDSLSGLPIEFIDLSGNTRYLYMIDPQYVDLQSLFKAWNFVNTAFCRVIEVVGESATDVNYNITVPLGFCFNINSLDHSGKAASATFSFCNGFLSRNTRNAIKLSLKCYYLGFVDPIEDDVYETPSLGAFLTFRLYDETVGLYLNYDDSSEIWSWSATAQDIKLRNLSFENNECVLLFNENRNTGDNQPHEFTISFLAASTIANSDIHYGPNTSDLNWGLLYATLKMEYVKSKTFFEDVLMGEFANPVLNNGNNIENGGDGEELQINFNTMACKKHTIDGSMMLPANSFCNAKTYIDTGAREKIEINDAKFERYFWGGSYYWDFVTSYAVVTDGNKVYIPVAVGMNPRMNTLKLTLVSTNVTSS